MGQCPFLSSNNTKVECFKECPFYNYNNEECPFKILDSYKHNIEKNYDDVNVDKNEFSFIKKYYNNIVEQYL